LAVPDVPSRRVTLLSKVRISGSILDFEGRQMAGHFSSVSSGRIFSEVVIETSRVLL
jgi:hypothetical protein